MEQMQQCFEFDSYVEVNFVLFYTLGFNFGQLSWSQGGNG